jgi:hypothetical protein
LTILIVSAGFIFGFIMASRTSLYSGITAAGLADAIGELSSTEGLQQNLYPAIFAAADAVGYSHLHKNDQATSSAQASDRLRIKVHREIIRISTNTADLDVMNKELKETVKYVGKSTRFKGTFFSKHDMEYSPVTSANNFVDLMTLLPDVSYEAQGPLIASVSVRSQQALADDWLIQSDRVKPLLFDKVKTLNPTFAARFNSFLRAKGSFFPMVRAMFHVLCEGDHGYKHTAFSEVASMVQDVGSPAEYLQIEQDVQTRARQLGDITINVPTYVAHHLVARFSQLIPSLANLDRNDLNLATCTHHMTLYVNAQNANSEAHAAVADPKNNTKGTVATKVEPGCVIEAGVQKCKFCKKPTPSSAHHSWNNCRQRKIKQEADQAAAKAAKASSKNKEAGQPPPHSHAHFSAAGHAPAQQPGVQAPYAYPPGPYGSYPAAFAPGFGAAPPAFGPPSAYGQNPWSTPPGQCTPNYAVAHHACVVQPPAHRVTQIIDCGASITTVGTSTPVHNSRPISMMLRTTQGYTQRIRQGMCTLRFPDENGRPISFHLQAITSPDIQTDLVLVSYHQLLRAGYRIDLYEHHGEIRTPTNECIRLQVQNGVWHFPKCENAMACHLQVPHQLAHMVLGGGFSGWRTSARPSPLNVPPQPEPFLSCIDAEEHMHSPHLMDIPDSPHFPLQEEQQPPVIAQQHSLETSESSLGSPDSDNSALQVAEKIVDQAGPVGNQQPPVFVLSQAQPAMRPSDPTKKPALKISPHTGKVVTGSLLTPQEAHEICKFYHSTNNHGSQRQLTKILRQHISNQAYRPSSQHIKQFICGPCAMAKSKLPPQRQTHPSTQTPTKFNPGESFYVDGSGSYNFVTRDGSTQHFIIADEASHAKFSFPTKDKKPETLIALLRNLRANWRVKTLKIRTDQEFSRSSVVRAWATDNDIALEETPPYVHQPNGKAERAHGLIQDLARVMKIESGAGNVLWSYACRYSAKLLNLKPTSADPKNRSPLQISLTIPYQHTQLEHPPFGCEMFAHVGQRTDCSTATAPRARPGVFIGIADNGPSYLMYEPDKHKVLKVGYAKFNVNNFPLKNMLIAGQRLLPDASVDPDGVRSLLSHTMEELTDKQLAEIACLMRLLIDLPAHWFPEYKHGWRLQCSKPNTRSGKVTVSVLYDQYHGPLASLPKNMRDYRTHPKDSVFQVSPPAKGEDYSLRHALRVTYPSCRTLADMVSASARNRGTYPPHPAIDLANTAHAHTAVFQQYIQHKENSSHIPRLTAFAARVVGGKRVMPLKPPPLQLTATGAIGFQPKSRRAAMQHPSWPMWKKAEDDECQGIKRRGVYARVPINAVPQGVKILHCTFIYTDKTTGPKARVCARGDEQDPYPDPRDTYASTPGAPLVRVLFSHATQHGHDLYKWDVSQAFTQAAPFGPDVHLYMYPPPGQEEPGYVWRLLRPLYGLAVAPAHWSATLRTFLHSDGWVPVAHGEDTMYKHQVKGGPDMFLIFHVDDILISAHPSCKSDVQAFKARFFQRFDTRDEGLVTRYIGMDVTRVQDRIYLSQAPLVQELVNSLGLSECNPTLMPMEAGTRLLIEDRPTVVHKPRLVLYQHVVGTLQYLHQWTRPDLGHATHELSKHLCNPGQVHMDAAIRTVRYLKGTPNYGLVYRKVYKDADRLIGFADADWAGDTDTRKSISANTFLCNGGAVLWHCKQQQGVATSTAEAEFVAASTAAKDAEWLRRVMAGMGMHQPGPTPIYEDNKACRLMSENPVQKSRTRHIDVAQHKVRQLVQDNIVRLIDCPTHDMAADVLTKALPAPAFRRHRDTILGYVDHSAPSIPSRLPAWTSAY